MTASMILCTIEWLVLFNMDFIFMAFDNNNSRKEVIKKFSTTSNDTGSPEVQIALLTQKISTLSDHMKDHKHDFSSKRGLLSLVARRRRLLDYLKKKDIKRYTDVISKLGLRK